MEICINTNVIDKDKDALAKYNKNWITYEISDAEQFFNDVIKKGYAHAFSTFRDGNRHGSNVKDTSLLGVDIDNPDEIHITTIDTLLHNEFVQQYCWFITTSNSNTTFHPRYHLYFKFDVGFNNENYFTKIAVYVINHLRRYGIIADNAIKSSASCFFGNTNAEFFLVNPNNFLSTYAIAELEEFEKLETIEVKTKDEFNINSSHEFSTETIEFLLNQVGNYYKFLQNNYNLTPEQARLPYNDWLALISAVANTLQDDDLAEQICTKFMPDLHSDKFTTKYKLKHKLQKFQQGTIKFYGAICWAATTYNVNLDEAKANYYLLYAHNFNKVFYAKFPTLQKKQSYNDAFFSEIYNPREKRYELKLDEGRLRRCVEKQGYQFLRSSNENSANELIRIKNRRATIESIESLQNFWTAEDGFTKDLPEQISDNFTRNDLRDLLMKKIPTIFTEKNITFLRFTEPKFLQDRRDCSYFTFNNGIAKVTRDGVKLLDYNDDEVSDYIIWDEKIRHKKLILQPELIQEIDGFVKFIAKEQLIFDDLTELQELYNKYPLLKVNYPSIIDNDYLLFLIKLCTKDTTFEFERFKALASGIAYAVHNYKDPSNARVIITTEVTTSKRAEGGTGKSLLWKPIDYLRKTSFFNGKTIENQIKSQFAYQTVNKSIDLININDVSRRFDLEALYSDITENLVIEQKYKKPYVIPFSKSPKYIVTTNYPPPTNNDSDVRRRHIIELQRYFNRRRQPVDFFKHNLINDWDADVHWQLFYHTIFYFLQEYFKNNCRLYEFQSEAFKLGQIRARTSDEFLQFMEEDFKPNIWYRKRYLTYVWATRYKGIEPSDALLPVQRTRAGIELQKFLKHFFNIYKDTYFEHSAYPQGGGKNEHIIYTTDKNTPRLSIENIYQDNLGDL